MFSAGVAQQQANKRDVADTSSFIFTVNTLGATNFQIPSSNVDYRLSWYEISTPANNDLDVAISSADHTINFGSDGIFHVSIDTINAGVTANDFDSFQFNNGGDKLKIASIKNWGSTVWVDLNSAYYGCTNLTVPATDAPDLSGATSLKSMFRSTTLANPDVTLWDTSNINDMYAAFHNSDAANPNVSGWDTSLVTDMRYMFHNADAFTRYSDLGNWNVAAVTTMQSILQSHTIPTADYNAILIAWDAQAVQTGVAFGGGGSQSSGAGATARANLIADHGWVFTDTNP
jgi:surface protein